MYCGMGWWVHDGDFVIAFGAAGVAAIRDGVLFVGNSKVEPSNVVCVFEASRS